MLLYGRMALKLTATNYYSTYISKELILKINQIDIDQQVFIVAEIGNNHEGL